MAHEDNGSTASAANFEGTRAVSEAISGEAPKPAAPTVTELLKLSDEKFKDKIKLHRADLKRAYAYAVNDFIGPNGWSDVDDAASDILDKLLNGLVTRAGGA